MCVHQTILIKNFKSEHNYCITMTEKGRESKVTVSFNQSDWEQVSTLLEKEAKKKERIHFRIEEHEKTLWESFVDDNLEYETLTDLILKSVRKTISPKKLRGHLRPSNPIEERFLSLWGIRKINKEISNSVLETEKHVKKINQVVMDSKIPDNLTVQDMIKKIQQNNIENLYLSAIIKKKMQK